MKGSLVAAAANRGSAAAATNGTGERGEAGNPGGRSITYHGSYPAYSVRQLHIYCGGFKILQTADGRQDLQLVVRAWPESLR